MSMKTLKYFLRKYEEKIIQVQAYGSPKDENGNFICMKLRTLPPKEVQKILDAYKRSSMAMDDNGRPYHSPTNEILHETKSDFGRGFDHLIAETLVEPDLKSKEVKDFYNCPDISEIPRLMFFDPKEYEYVSNAVMDIHNLGRKQKKDEDLAVEVKNSSSAGKETSSGQA